MKKSPIRQQVIHRLAALNDQLCFFLLLEDELTRRLADFGPGAEKVFTTDVFAQNQYARRLHVTLGDLPSFQSVNRSFTFASYFATSYEVASDFFDQATQLLVRVNHAVAAKKAEGGPEDQYIRTLEKSQLATPQLELTRTFSYCRYRRNAFVHIAEEASGPYKSLTYTHGIGLNDFWGTTREKIDFTFAKNSDVNEDEVICLMKLLRICVERLDDHLASILNLSGVVDLIAVNRFGSEAARMNNEVAKVRTTIVKSLLQSEYGGSAHDSVIDLSVRRVGIRDMSVKEQ